MEPTNTKFFNEGSSFFKKLNETIDVAKYLEETKDVMAPEDFMAHAANGAYEAIRDKHFEFTAPPWR